ncbi:guanylate kinase [Neolewinella agarilytica]|uniref:guanylate kinase n=1 Tax=Neolewinella agarilytica TaxID=478744 RepID=UPI002357166E|nr:guanylate kinase [Neolewinella agarilytica]
MSPDPTSGKMLIFTAPSGAGKTTIVRHLLKHFGELAFSVSATNRPIREGEEDGRSYYFLSTEEFEAKIAAGDFVEYEEVYPGRFYGTLRSEIERIWANGQAIVFDIEVKGATNLKKFYPEESTAVFVAPPSPEVLFQRLRDRQTESEAEIQTRIDRAGEELTYVNSFDRVLLNDDLETALAEAESIVLDVLGIVD